MGLFGKILLFVNFLAFGGLLYVATQDWAARNAAAANAVRHQLVIVGMPVETSKLIDGSDTAIPVDVTISGAVPIETVSAKLLEEHFAGTGSEEFSGAKFPKNQLEEVGEVEKKVFAKLSSLSPKEKLELLCGRYDTNRNGATVFLPGWLTLMAETNAERMSFRQLSEPSQFQRQPQKLEANAKLAEAALSKRFEVLRKVDPRQAEADAIAVKEASDNLRKANDEAKRKYDAYAQAVNDTTVDQAAQNQAVREASEALDKLTEAYSKFQNILATMNQTACRDENDRRKRIAHLLMHLSESAGWQKRVALLVGLRTYLSTMSDHVNRFQKYTAAGDQQIYLDQSKFAEEYDLLKNLAIGQSLLLRQQVTVRVDQQFQRSRDEETTRIRLQLLEERRKTLADVEAQVTAALVNQAEVEQRLFTVQKLIGETLQKNFALEAELVEAEKK